MYMMVNLPMRRRAVALLLYMELVPLVDFVLPTVKALTDSKWIISPLRSRKKLPPICCSEHDSETVVKLLLVLAIMFT